MLRVKWNGLRNGVGVVRVMIVVMVVVKVKVDEF